MINPKEGLVGMLKRKLDNKREKYNRIRPEMIAIKIELKRLRHRIKVMEDSYYKQDE